MFEIHGYFLQSLWVNAVKVPEKKPRPSPSQFSTLYRTVTGLELGDRESILGGGTDLSF
jgi:hypothetical protein